MKIKESVYEISDVINMHRSDQTNLNFFKIFSLPVWLVIISISLSLASESVSAGIEDADLYYRYVPYQGPSSTTETPKQSSGASETEAKKAEQAPSPGEKGGAAGQAAAGQSTQQANAPKTECPMSGEQRPPVERPEKSTGEFPSGTYPSFCQADVNGDHYVTKDELQNFPELLRVFDKVDAGKDGKLEQHEFVNLEMETSREGEI
ncbi:MAG TPA: EF-hand domain-containing protein [Methylobacter sp.]